MIDHKPKAARYILIFLIVAVMTLPLSFLATSALRISGCNPTPAQSGNFMAYCWKTDYADYEHGAYWLPTEPKALQAARKANILFLGDSRMQYAFSTDIINEYSSRTGNKHYLLGFAGEGDQFAEKLMSRQNLRPKMVVINLDGFAFFDQPRGTTQSAITLETKPLSSWVEYSVKRTGQVLQRTVCDTSRVLPGKTWLCGTVANREDVVYRSVRNGHWQTADRLVINNNLPIATAPPPPRLWFTDKNKILGEARQFAQQIKDWGICVVAINVPQSNTSDTVAAQQATAMNVPLILTSRQGLYSFDGSHLTPKSAIKYSSDVVAQLTQYMDRCLARK